MTVEQQNLYEDFIRKAGSEIWHVEIGPDILSGSGLPSHSDVHMSVITNERIQASQMSSCYSAFSYTHVMFSDFFFVHNMLRKC